MGRRIGKGTKKASTSRTKSQLTNAKTLTAASPETRARDEELLDAQAAGKAEARLEHNQRRALSGE